MTARLCTDAYCTAVPCPPLLFLLCHAAPAPYHSPRMSQLHCWQTWPATFKWHSQVPHSAVFRRCLALWRRLSFGAGSCCGALCGSAIAAPSNWLVGSDGSTSHQVCMGPAAGPHLHADSLSGVACWEVSWTVGLVSLSGFNTQPWCTWWSAQVQFKIFMRCAACLRLCIDVCCWPFSGKTCWLWGEGSNCPPPPPRSAWPYFGLRILGQGHALMPDTNTLTVEAFSAKLFPLVPSLVVSSSSMVA